MKRLNESEMERVRVQCFPQLKNLQEFVNYLKEKQYVTRVGRGGRAKHWEVCEAVLPEEY